MQEITHGNQTKQTTRREFLKGGAMMATAGIAGGMRLGNMSPLGSLAAASAATSEGLLGNRIEPRPNLLHILTDQQRFDTIRALGNPVIETPNLDRLAHEGIAFTDAHVACPVCVPSRCSMHYGQYPHNTGCYENAWPWPEDQRESFVGALKKTGYRTHGVGKCHFRPEAGALRGFETREGQEHDGQDGGDAYLQFLEKNGYSRLAAHNEYEGAKGLLYYVPQISMLPESHHHTTWIGDRSVTFIEEESGKNRPWFLFSSFLYPHPPFGLPPPWHERHHADMMSNPLLPEPLEPLLTETMKRQNLHTGGGKGWRPFDGIGTDGDLIRWSKAFYYSSITFVDYQVGRILDALERSNQLENTLILFTSDHGEYLWDYNSLGKRSMHDVSTRVPLLMRLPGMRHAGRRVNKPVSLVDVAPTFLAAGGAGIETHPLDGVNLIDVIEERSAREAVFSHIARRGNEGSAEYMCVTRDVKYFHSAPEGKTFLFDRREDPFETVNLASDASMRSIAREHHERTVEWLRTGVDKDLWLGDRKNAFPWPV